MTNLEFKQQLIFSDKYGIDANQLLLLTIILLAQNNEDAELVQLYFKSKAKGSLLEQLTKLQEVGIINKSYVIAKGNKLDIHKIPINKHLIKDFYKCSFDMGKELFEEYPQFALINGNYTSLRGVSKKFNSLEDCYRVYGKAIGWKPEVHEHIIELVKWAKENRVLNCSLASFVVNHGWLDLEALRNGDTANINFDAIKVV